MPRYQQLPSDAPLFENPDLPPDPPAYQVPEQTPSFEEFEIDDPLSNEPQSRLVDRARLLREKLVSPITRLLDPVADAWRVAMIKFDVFLAKVGNPLIIKRFLYVLVVSVILYLVVNSGLLPNNIALLNGQFNDESMLVSYIKAHTDPKRMEENLEYLSLLPHIAGTSGDLVLARYVHNAYGRAGISPRELSEVKSFLNYPEIAELSMDGFTATLAEPLPDGNASLPYRSFSFLSADGRVDGPVVFVNFGRSLDFVALKETGVSVQGGVCFARYGRILASLKVKHGTEHGCGAMVFFKDPQSFDTQIEQERLAVERTSVAFSEYASGDVLTPGWPSIDSNPRIGWPQSETAPKIPTLPVSYEDALPFLKAIQNKGAEMTSKEWLLGDGSDLGFKTPWSGGSKKDSPVVTAHFNVETSKREVKPLWNVVGKITGIEQSEKSVIVGAKRDAACFGTCSSNTGTTVLLELVEMFTQLQRKLNWEPLRSVYFISIDGSEYNYAGITEWVEERFRELRKEAFAYIDLTGAIEGHRLDVMTNPVFEDLLMQVFGEVQVPETAQDDGKGAKLTERFKENDFRLVREYGNFYPFLSFVGTPVMQIRFASDEKPKDEYSMAFPHSSCYDTFERFKQKNIDPDMKYHAALVEIILRVIVRLIDDPFVPFGLEKTYERIKYYIEDLLQYTSAIRPGNTLDVANFQQANELISKTADLFARWKATWEGAVKTENGGLEPSLLSVRRWEWNLKLIALQRFSVLDSGLSQRPWIKNMFYAPQVNEPEELKNDKGEKFEWWTFPSVRDAVQAGDMKLAQAELDLLLEMLNVVGAGF